MAPRSPLPALINASSVGTTHVNSTFVSYVASNKNGPTHGRAHKSRGSYIISKQHTTKIRYLSFPWNGKWFVFTHNCFHAASLSYEEKWLRWVSRWFRLFFAILSGDIFLVGLCAIPSGSSFTNRNYLTHWGRDKIDAISQTACSSAFSWMKMFEFHLRFHWSLFLRVQLTIFHHWFR